jgi:Calpain family cysteine protease
MLARSKEVSSDQYETPTTSFSPLTGGNGRGNSWARERLAARGPAAPAPETQGAGAALGLACEGVEAEAEDEWFDPLGGLLAQQGPVEGLGAPPDVRAHDRTAPGRNPYTGQPKLYDGEYTKSDHEGADSGVMWRSMADCPMQRDGFQFRDVRQGIIGDCYLMSALAALARSNPKAIEEMIKPSGTRYLVRFFQYDEAFGRYQPKWVEVSPEFPTIQSGNKANGAPNPMMVYAGCGSRPQDRPEIWVPLIEKAFAQWKSREDESYGGYGAVGNGGSAGGAMAALTGKRSNNIANQAFAGNAGDQASLLTAMQRALAAGQAVTADTHCHSMAVVSCDSTKVELWDPHGKLRPYRTSFFFTQFVRVEVNGKTRDLSSKNA